MDEFTKSGCAWMSEDVRALIKAFATAKKNFKATGKAGKTKQWDYAQLEDIYNAVEGALYDQEIAVKHAVTTDHSGREILATRLIHWPTGQWSEDIRYLDSEKPGNQGKGAAQTYSRRYALLVICGIPQSCDDGIDEQKYIEQQKLPISESQKAELIKLITSAQLWSEIRSIYCIDKIEQLPAAKFNSLIKFIESKK